MSSREIAELLGARHDSVKRTVERLAETGRDRMPTVGGCAGRRRVQLVYTTQEYRLDKRSSLIVVAQRSPEFTARVVDRWREPEVAKSPAVPDFNDPKVLREYLLASTEREIVLQNRIDVMQVDVAKRLTKAEGFGKTSGTPSSITSRARSTERLPTLRSFAASAWDTANSPI